MIDRLGTCPCCGASWNGGDILDQIKKLDVFTHTAPSDIVKVARSMGWSEENKTSFTKLVVYEVDGIVVLECHNDRCKHVFTADGVDMGSMTEYREAKKLA